MSSGKSRDVVDIFFFLVIVILLVLILASILSSQETVNDLERLGFGGFQ